MLVELKPEIERLVQEEILCGRFHSVAEVIEEAVHVLRRSSETLPPARLPRQNLADFLLDSPFAGSELDFERVQDYGGPIEL